VSYHASIVVLTYYHQETSSLCVKNERHVHLSNTLGSATLYIQLLFF